jgi:hypothetical protein
MNGAGAVARPGVTGTATPLPPAGAVATGTATPLPPAGAVVRPVP